MLRVEEALERILADITRLEPENVALPEAAGRVLAQAIASQEEVPPFANSAMDGYALRSSDTQEATPQGPRRLRLVGIVQAGQVAKRPLEAGEAMRILTGAPVPPGADAVIQQELTQTGGSGTRATNGSEAEGWVEVQAPVARWNNIRHPGEDIRRGTRVLAEGAILGPSEIGVLASLGVAEVVVYRRPVVAILATGDELVEIHQALRPGQIRNSNSYLIAAAVAAAGGIPRRLGIARDQVEELRAKLQAAQEADLIITSGGVSVGDYDLVKDIMREQGVIDFWRVNLKPGKPLAFGRLGGTPLLGLPGNPVSAAVTFELFARPVLRKMQGFAQVLRPVVQARLLDSAPEGGNRRHYVRAHVALQDGVFVARTTGPQDSHILTSMVGANALLVIPENSPSIPPGEVVQSMLLVDGLA
ncbi:MAG TPA: gephyrin-like molybdotransferase Glp [Ktedonobacterales bacterium]|nr:gephyrin-like molybdotransferase Glp [Ktedonobacterales bacterium]